MMTQVRKMLAALPDIWESLLANTWPEKFLRVTLGLSEEWIGRLPDIAQICMVLYFLMAVAALALHFGRKQYSFSSIRRKLTDLALTALMPLLVRIIVVIFRVGQELAADIEGSFSFTSAGISWLGAVVSTWFFPMGLCLIILVCLSIPLTTVKKYLDEYGLAGVIWSVYDVGFGILCLSAAVLSMYTGNVQWYWTLAAAGVLNLLGQTGGINVD